MYLSSTNFLQGKDVFAKNLVLYIKKLRIQKLNFCFFITLLSEIV